MTIYILTLYTTLDHLTKTTFYLHSVNKHVHKIELIQKLKLYKNEINLIFPRRPLDAKYFVN